MSIKGMFNYKRYFLKALQIQEAYLLSKSSNPRTPQFFILGLPRTGTTLIYQYIVHRLHIAYLTNGTGIYPFNYAPCFTTWFQIHTHMPYKSDFKSFYGKVKGYLAPREAGGVWLRFFDIDNYMKYEEIKERDRLYLERTVWCIQNIFKNAPFVNKNVKHILRIDALSKILPSSIFIVVQRNLTDVALSLLEGRKKLGDVNKWLSVKPENYDELKNLDYLDQIAYQVDELQKRLKKDIGKTDNNRVFILNYEQFCKNPEFLIDFIISKASVLKFKNPPINHFNFREREAKTKEEKKLVEKICLLVK